MQHYGLIGYPLSASFSKTYFTAKFKHLALLDAVYENYPLEQIADIRDLLRTEPLRGFNVTSPYKQAILPYLDLLDPQAEVIGAVNTVKRMPDGRLKGYNTDVDGFIESWRNWHAPTDGLALIFGTGGAARAVAFALSKMGCQVALVSRCPHSDAFSYPVWSYSDVWDSPWAESLIWIQASPLGMAHQAQTCLELPYVKLSPSHWACDLIYNPAQTVFLKRCHEHGAHVKNGLEMLEAQAETAWRIWQSE